MNAWIDVLRTHPPTAAVREIAGMFGIRSARQVFTDLSRVLASAGSGFQLDPSTAGFFRPDLGIPTYLGRRPRHRLAPIFHCFDRVGGGKHYSQRVTRKTATDFRGKHLSYDEHDGVDFACPIGTELVAAAPGHVVMIRDTWLRGGLTVAVDHGDGLLTQYTHCWKPLVERGQRVRRGQAVALSGSAGIDMTISIPFVSPHIHFMVWDHGRPVDPFLGEGEPDRAGTWIERNSPSHALYGADEPAPEYSDVDERLVHRVVRDCRDPKIAAELEALGGNAHFIAAYLEDSFHHDAYAWPDETRAPSLRRRRVGTQKLGLPLSREHYDGAFFADAWITDASFWRATRSRWAPS